MLAFIQPLWRERNGWKVLSESALCTRAENPCSGFSPVRVCVVFRVCATESLPVVRVARVSSETKDSFIHSASPSPNDSSTPYFHRFPQQQTVAFSLVVVSKKQTHQLAIRLTSCKLRCLRVTIWRSLLCLRKHASISGAWDATVIHVSLTCSVSTGFNLIILIIPIYWLVWLLAGLGLRFIPAFQSWEINLQAAFQRSWSTTLTKLRFAWFASSATLTEMRQACANCASCVGLLSSAFLLPEIDLARLQVWGRHFQTVQDLSPVTCVEEIDCFCFCLLLFAFCCLCH